MRIFGDPSDGVLNRKDWVFLGLLPLPFDLAFGAPVAEGLLFIASSTRTDMGIASSTRTDMNIASATRTDMGIASSTSSN